MNLKRALILAVTWASTIGLHGCAKMDLSEELERLNIAKQQWTQLNVTEYRYFSKRDCYCDYGNSEVLIAVKNGVVTEVVDSGNEFQSRFTVAAEDYPKFWSVEEAFVQIQEAIDKRVEYLEVTYDETNGFPTRVEIDYSKNTMRDEIDFKNRVSYIIHL